MAPCTTPCSNMRYEHPELKERLAMLMPEKNKNNENDNGNDSDSDNANENDSLQMCQPVLGTY